MSNMPKCFVPGVLFFVLLGCGSLPQPSKMHFDESADRSMSIVYDSGSAWTMSDELNATFVRFLDTELATLQQNSPELYWPDLGDSDQTFQNVFLTAFLSTTDTYKNRDFQCAFLQSVSSRLDKRTRTKLNSLTEDGAVCIQGDLPRDKQVEWTHDLLMFFWEEPWIATGDGYIGLESLIVRQIGIEQYIRPKILVGTRIDYDGYGWGYSPREKILFNSDPHLSAFRDTGSKYDPNDGLPFNLLGDDILTQLQQNPYGMASIVSIDSRIYISPTIAPSEMIELLVHEYAHVYHGEQGENLAWDSLQKKLHVYGNAVHTEGLAEAFTWILLQDVYRQYQQTRFFHLAKLRLFHKFRPNDPHLVGRAGTYYDEMSIVDIQDLARTLDFENWMNERDISNLVKGAALPRGEMAVLLPESSSLQRITR